MGHPSDSWARSSAEQRHHLRRCWRQDCELDPLILRVRLLRLQGCLPQARCLEQELLPLF